MSCVTPFTKVDSIHRLHAAFLSWVIIAGISFLLLSQSSGIFNKMLVGLGFAKYDFLTNENSFWALLTIQNIWKETGWGQLFSLLQLQA